MKPIVAVFALIVAVVGCESSTRAATESVAGIAADAAPPPAPPFAARPEERQSFQVQATADRKIIRTGELRIELEDVESGSRLADSIAAAVGGSVTSTRAFHGEKGHREANLTIRIPTTRFTEALNALRQLGRVRVDNTNADDVTRAYNDLEIRLAVKRDLVNRLRALLNTRTGKLSEIIEVERELARAVTELEQMEGERRFLDNQIAMSTIQATLFHTPIAGPGNFLDPIAAAVRESIQLLGRSVAALVSAVVFIAPWIIVMIAVWRAWRYLRGRRLARAGDA